MNNRISKTVSIVCVASMVLAGCSAPSFDAETINKIQHIGENVTVISSNIEEQSEKVAESIEKATETAAELTETVNEINEVIAEEEVTEITAEEVALAEDEAIELADLDDEDILARIQGNILAELLKYREQGEALIAMAISKRDSGLEKINKGLNDFNTALESIDENSTADEIIDEAFDGAQLALDGANEMAAGATIIVDDAAVWARDIVETAEILGVDNAQLQNTKELINQVDEFKVEFVSEALSQEIDTYREYTKIKAKEAGELTQEEIEAIIPHYEIEINVDANPSEYLEEAFAKADAIVKQSNAILDSAGQLYVLADSVAKSILEEAKNLGLDSSKIDEIESMMTEYESMIDDGLTVSKNSLKEVATYLNIAMTYTKNKTIEDYIADFGL